MAHFTWLPANRAAPEDVEAVFATGGDQKCRCQALKVPGWIWRDTTQEQRDAALVEQTACGTAGPTSGLIGYVDGEAAGWVAGRPQGELPPAVEPEAAVDADGPPARGRLVGHLLRRAQGLAYDGAVAPSFAAATVEYGEQVGAKVLEGYPIEPPPGKSVIWDEASVGLLQVFLGAGYEVVASPTLRRRVVRRRLAGAS